MRVESPVLPQSLVESSKALEKKDVASKGTGERQLPEESQPLAFSPLGTGGTYSVMSLRAAVDHHVKFLAVAENNMKAIHHPPTIPSELLEGLRAK